jgi:hypothetical protein
MVPGVVWLDVQVICLQNTRYWLTYAGCKAYIAGLCLLCIKPLTFYLWCGAGFRNSPPPPLSIYIYIYNLVLLTFHNMQGLGYRFGSFLSIKLCTFLPFASCEALVRAGVFKPWSTGCVHPSCHFCAAPKEGKTEITQFTICYTTSNHLITTFRCGNFSFEEVT